MLGENVLSTPRLISAESVIENVISGRSRYGFCSFLMSSAGQPVQSQVWGCCSMDIQTGQALSHCKPVTDWGRLLSCFSCKHATPVLVLLVIVNTCSLFRCCFPLQPSDCFFSLVCKSFLTWQEVQRVVCFYIYIFFFQLNSQT